MLTVPVLSETIDVSPIGGLIPPGNFLLNLFNYIGVIIFRKVQKDFCGILF